MEQPYEEILAQVNAALSAVEGADLLTVWEEVEPTWWINIVEARRKLYAAKVDLAGAVAPSKATGETQ